MTTFIVLISLTEQGVRNIGHSVQRAEAFRHAAEAAGVTRCEAFWTLGQYDGVLILEAPDEESITSLLLSLCAQGNVRTHALRAFERLEFEAILESVTP